MQKTDESIYKIVSASVKRHSMDIETWEKTKLWNEGNEETKNLLLSKIRLEINELPILYFFVDQEIWTVFTTRAVYSSNAENVEKLEITNIKEYKFDVARFKGIAGNQSDFITIKLKDGTFHKILYETGNPSMAAIYGIQTLVQIS